MRIIFRQLFACAARLGTIGLVVVGVSGGVAAGLGAVAGRAFVAGDPPGVTYTPSRCAEFHEYAPHARTCEAAAVVHHFGEVVTYRLGAGILGLVLFGVLVLARRRYAYLLAEDRLPLAFEDTVGATVFGLAGVALFGFGLDQVALKHDGAGFFLSGGIVAAVAAAAFAVRFVRTLGSPSVTGTR
jgi:hypothetical protein